MVYLFKIPALWFGIEHTIVASEHNLKKANKEFKISKEETNNATEQVQDMKKKMVDEDAINKFHMEDA